MTELLPCPWCGVVNVHVEAGDTFRWRYACCADCGAHAPEVDVQTMGDGNPAEWEIDAQRRALEAWNRRPTTGAARDAGTTKPPEGGL